MAYVKILDSNVIDLASWQQIINVVNQHSDSIAQLSNNYDASWSQSYSDSNTDWSSSFDLGSNLMVYGKAKLSAATVETGVNSTYYIQDDVQFQNDGSAVFSGTPIIIATATAGATTEGRFTATVTTHAVDSSGFSVTIGDLQNTDYDSVTISWVAIGPR